MAGTIRIAVLANASQAKTELKSVASAAESISAKFSKFRAPAAAALGAIGLGAGKAIKSASDLNETVSKSNQIFGSNSAAIQQWAGGAAQNLGLSKQAALESASGFGDMFTQLGFAGDQAAGMSQKVVQMSADLGSFNNLPTADVTDKIAGAFRGEYDGLQTLIPNISAARVESEAMAATGKKTASQLTAQEKATAVLAIVQKDGARAQGDFARTASGAANSQKIAAASASDLSAKLGQALLPAYTKVLQVGIQFLGFLSQHQAAVTVVIAVVAGLAAVVLALSVATTIYNGVMAVAKGAMVAYTAVQWLLNAAMTANPIGIIVVGIALLIAGFILLYQHSETFRNILAAIGQVGVAIWGGIKTAALAVWAAIVAYVRFQIAVLTAVIRVIVAVAKAVWDAIKAAAQAVWGFITAYIRTEINIIKTVIKAIVAVAKAVWDAIKSAAVSVWKGITSAFTSAVNSIKSGFSKVKSFASDVLSKIKGLFSASALVDAGRKLMQGLADGISRGIGKAIDAVRRGVQKIKDLLPGSPIKSGPLKSWNNGGAGKRLMALLAGGIRAGAPGVRTSLSDALDPALCLWRASAA
jgi:hypothetical protein